MNNNATQQNIMQVSLAKTFVSHDLENHQIMKAKHGYSKVLKLKPEEADCF